MLEKVNRGAAKGFPAGGTERTFDSVASLQTAKAPHGTRVYSALDARISPRQPGSLHYRGTMPSLRSKPPTRLSLFDRSGQLVLVDLPAFHDEDDAPNGGNVLQRIAVNGDDVCLHAGSDGTDFVLHPE